MSDLSVSLGEVNGDGRRPITYRFGQAEYPDKLDLSNAWQREQSIKRALESFGLPADCLPALGAEVARLAAERDKAGSSLKPIEFRRISCAELDAAGYDLEYLIDGALVARQDPPRPR